jgi:2-polyprenyl-3-methyl-5-hydroxy-6-metoxy-1,4-benzoquinol methylase
MRTRDAEIRELLDDATVDASALDDDALRRNLADIRRINAWLGWTRFAVQTVMRHVRSRGLHAFSLLDVATGSADIPRALARRAAREGIHARILATDVSSQIVRVARERLATAPSVEVDRCDALALPYDAGSFDIALCTLALHHFDPDSAVELLKNLSRVGHRVLVFDVERSAAAYAGAVLLTRLARMDAITRHDAPASVRRAYSADELRALAARAELRGGRVWVRFPFRLALEAPGKA